MKRIFVTKNTLLVKNLFYITENLTHYNIFFTEGTIKLIKPLSFRNSEGHPKYLCVYSHLTTLTELEKNNLFVSSNRKNKISFHSFNSFVDLQLNYKITNVLLIFLNYKEK